MYKAFASGIFVISTAFTVAGCTPMQSRIDPPYPFKGDVFNEEEIQKIAAQTCGFEDTAELPPDINPFTTDGCTLWPDGNWRECCIAHDILYWCSEGDLSRKETDQALRDCVRERDSPANAFFMYWGTRLTALPWLPFPWRWGYGYRWLEKQSASRSVPPQSEDQE